MTILFQCRKCGLQGAPTLEGHRCVAAAPDRLEMARAILSEASESVGAEVGKAAFREAATHGQAFVKDGRMLKREEVLAAPTEAEKARFDRAAYQKAYMKTYMKAYMRGWRARRKAR